jgi:hypothetical protein
MSDYRVVFVEAGNISGESRCVVMSGLARIAEFYGAHAEEYANLFVQACQKQQANLRRAKDMQAVAGGE